MTPEPPCSPSVAAGAPSAGPAAAALADWQPVEGPPEEYGLALSGGGIRATLFHLGALWRINELGRLREIGRVSGVSGGSIAAGFLAKVWPQLRWDANGVSPNFAAAYGTLVFRLARMPLDVPVIALGLVPGVSAANVLAAVLDRFFLRGMTLQDLPADGDGPRFVFNATDLGTGTDFRFSRPYMGSYRLGLVPEPNVPVAVAVAASAAFPPFVSPLTLHVDPSSFVAVPGSDLNGRPELLGQIALADGGAYDNLALEPITGRCHTYLVSDAGGNLTIQPPGWQWALWTTQVKRTLDIAVAQSRALRRRALPADTGHDYTLWRTRMEPATFSAPAAPAFEVRAGWGAYMAGLPTRLWPFPLVDRRRLVNWGYLTSDLALRSFVWRDAAPPSRLPFPDVTFDGLPPPTPALAGAAR